MNFLFLDFDTLSPGQIHDMLRLRQQVFILEQNCLYEDVDGADPFAKHLLIYDDHILAGYLRIFPAGTKFEEEVSIGRIVVHKNYRGTGLGKKLIEKGIELCKGTSIRIEAQAALRKYYHQFGFKEEGEVYEVDGIDHLQMVLKS